jgi:hypothetical protein
MRSRIMALLVVVFIILVLILITGLMLASVTMPGSPPPSTKS